MLRHRSRWYLPATNDFFLLFFALERRLYLVNGMEDVINVYRTVSAGDDVKQEDSRTLILRLQPLGVSVALATDGSFQGGANVIGPRQGSFDPLAYIVVLFGLSPEHLHLCGLLLQLRALDPAHAGGLVVSYEKMTTVVPDGEVTVMIEGGGVTKMMGMRRGVGGGDGGSS